MRSGSVALAFVGLGLFVTAPALQVFAQNPDKGAATDTRRVEIERLTVKSSRPFQAVVDALEGAVGHPDMAEFSKTVKNARSYSEIQRLVDRSVSTRGLMQFARFDDGEILRKESGLDKPKIVRYLIGNPLIMKEMVRYVPDAASYAPVTVLIDERADGVHVSYDLMASFLAPYGNAQASAVAAQLDEKVLALLTAAAE